ncbi:hypothetical protein P7K49_015711 [Saguinus oedipus]|uniref:Uncharacterized protein n=1 Tax=Saguinus oedipus TaxID=9490 RepID=A0ABQ9VAF9_SAGOE|nr:hypothetical protein P7K49_015711 [Saguinus oedipus]
MGSKYPPSIRGCLPFWALTLEAALILVFFFFTYYDTSLEDQKVLMAFYQAMYYIQCGIQTHDD